MITAVSSTFDPSRCAALLLDLRQKTPTMVGTVGRILAGEQIGFKHKLHAAAEDAAYI